MLADYQIVDAVRKKHLDIDPFTPEQVQPASYDMRLGRNLRLLMPESGIHPIDLKAPHDWTAPQVIDDGGYVLRGFALAVTEERVRMPADYVARVEGKSSLARLGLFTHITAGFIDPGFVGHITLELYCPHPRGIVIYAGMPVCQVSFQVMHGVAKVPYSGKYQGSSEPLPVASKFYRNFREHGGRY